VLIEQHDNATERKMRNVNQKADQLQRVIEKLTRMLAQKNIVVTQRGVQAYCEFDQRTGKVKRINLPVIPPEPSEAFINALHGYLDHEVGHALFTDPRQEKRVASESDLKIDPSQRHSMVNIVDDVRIENLMAEEFRGSIDNLEATRIFVQDTMWGPELEKLDYNNPVDRMVATTVGLVPYLRALGGHKACERFVDEHKLAPLFKPLLDKMPNLERRLKGLRTSTEVANLADELLRIMRPPPPPPQPQQPPPPPQDEQEPQDDDSEGDGEGEGGKPPPQDEEKSDEAKDESEGEDKDQDGEGAGGSEDESESDKHEADKDAPEDDSPEGDETEGDEGGEEQDDTDRDGEGAGDPDDDDDDAGDGEDEGGSDGDEDGEDEGEGAGSDSDGDEDEGDDRDDRDDGMDSEGQSADTGSDDGDEGDDEGEEGEAEAGGDEDAGDEKTQANPEQQDHEGQGGSLDESDEPEAQPMQIDLDGLKDMDEALGDIIRDAMNGAFDGTQQTDFSRDFDVIEPYPSDGISDTSDIEDLVKKLTGPMQKELQRIMVARAQSYNVGGYRSGRLSGPSLHRVKVGDDRCFKRRVEAPTNQVAVSLVCDISGSMSGHKMQMAMISAWAFASVLDKLKIPHEVLGFTTTNFSRSGATSHEQQRLHTELEQMYRDTGLPKGSIRFTPVYMPIFKGFGEAFGVEQKKRMTRMVKTQQGMGSNNDAVALQVASERLLRRPEPRKIMIVFSDGKPTCGSVHPQIIGASMKAIIARIQKQGVETIGVGILDSTVRQFYPKSFVLDNVMNLPKLVMNELKALLIGK
jgi:cobalamin biosynthesis protein CobT